MLTKRLQSWFEKLPVMIGTSAFGLLFQWLLRVKFPDTPLLHGGYWILVLALLGAYLDRKKGLLPKEVWTNRPELLGYFILFSINGLLAFWFVMLLDALGLGFDTTMLGWPFKTVIIAATVLAIGIASAEAESASNGKG